MLFLPGAAISFVVLPLMGQMLNRGMPPQYMIIAGFAALGWFAYLLSRNNLATGADDFFWPIILRAVGLGLIIVPLTQLAVSGLKGHAIPQGVALNNMMRQLGGSFGIALINTYIAHRTALHRTDLVTHLAPGSPATDERLAGLAQGLIARGASLFEAPQRALGVLEVTISRHATLLSYLDAFFLVALGCALCVPLVLLTGRPKSIGAAARAAAAPE